MTNKPDMLEATLAYAKKGLSVIPCHHIMGDGSCSCGNKDCSAKGKHPRFSWKGKQKRRLTETELRSHWKKHPDDSVGIVTGEISEIIVIDIDGKKGLASLESIGLTLGTMPMTPMVKTGGGGYHLYYRYHEGVAKTKVNVLSKVDIRAEGGIVIAPPSKHSSGKRYQWLEGKSLNDIPIADFDFSLLIRPESPSEEQGAAKFLDGVEEGERDWDAYKYACRLFSQGLRRDEVTPLVLLAASRCAPPFSEKEALAKVESASKYERKTTATSLGEPPKIISAKELLEMNLPPIKFALPGMIVEGLTIITAKPKAGKGWWVLQAAYSVALGKNLFDGSECEKGRVLYMGLEDSLRRLQYRVNEINNSTMFAKIIGKSKGGSLRIQAHLGHIPEGLDLTTRWPKIDEGCLEYLEKYLDDHPDTRLIVIDIFKRIAKAKKGKGSTYEEDYESIQPIQELAGRRRVAVIVVHHNRKAGAEDPIDMVSGTFGLTGGVDSVIVIQRATRGETYDESKFSFVGRDIDERELAMRFDKASHMWALIGDADTHFVSETRKGILDSLGDDSMLPSELAKLMGRNVHTIQNLLLKMLKDGQVDKDSKGRYTAFKIQMDDKLFRGKKWGG